jgi:hypothetical protein
MTNVDDSGRLLPSRRDRRSFLRTLFAVAILGCGLSSVSCSPHVNNPTPPNEKETTPVSGVVKVNGEPGHGVQVTLNPVGGMDASNPTMSVGEGDLEGKFRISTYGGNDGAPPGEYMLTFQWFDRTVVRIGGGDPKDMFNGKYAEKTDHMITVPKGPEPLDLGTIELTSDQPASDAAPVEPAEPAK